MEIYGMHIVDKAQYEETKFQHDHSQVIISFYGESNVGKSTLLNAIMGDRYVLLQYVHLV